MLQTLTRGGPPLTSTIALPTRSQPMRASSRLPSKKGIYGKELEEGIDTRAYRKRENFMKEKVQRQGS
jgi:hypothetical protein